MIRLRSPLFSCLAAVLALAGCDTAALDRMATSLETSAYDYRDTRKLVNAVKKASLLVEGQGPDAFDTFRKRPDIWNEELYNLYVYTLDGTCLYHPERPDFIGRNLLDVTDSQGRKALRHVMAAVNDANNPHGWVHYVWQPHLGLHPVEKSSSNFKVTMPDGQAVVVGGGITKPLEEKTFAKVAVDSAVDLLQEQGAAGLAVIRDPRERFRFRQVKVFVLQLDGTALVDPSLDMESPRNLLEHIDISGNQPFRTMFDRLRDEKSCWVIILDHNRYRRVMGKKAIYARKGVLEGRDVVIGAITSLPKPVWSN